jgi:hypothetical protein
MKIQFVFISWPNYSILIFIWTGIDSGRVLFLEDRSNRNFRRLQLYAICYCYQQPHQNYHQNWQNLNPSHWLCRICVSLAVYTLIWSEPVWTANGRKRKNDWFLLLSSPEPSCVWDCLALITLCIAILNVWANSFQSWIITSEYLSSSWALPHHCLMPTANISSKSPNCGHHISGLGWCHYNFHGG